MFSSLNRRLHHRNSIAMKWILFLFIVTDSKAFRPKYYYIEHNTLLNWNDAQNYCSSLGMNLFTLDDENEYNLLRKLIQEKYNKFLPYWTDARRHSNNDTFIWYTSGEGIKFAPWFKGEPNNSNMNENCVHSIWNSFEWNDRDCIFEARFICELEMKK